MQQALNNCFSEDEYAVFKGNNWVDPSDCPSNKIRIPNYYSGKEEVYEDLCAFSKSRNQVCFFLLHTEWQVGVTYFIG